jgi:acyl dehydratase
MDKKEVISLFINSIGAQSNKVKNSIERGAVRKFAEAIGDPHPLFIDEEYGKRSRYNKNIVPVTFPQILDYGSIEGLSLPSAGLIHGEQEYRYQRPLCVGEEIYCYSTAEDYYEKTGTSGTMGFLTLKRYGEDAMGNEIFSSLQIIILTEAVRKGMTV